MTAIAAFKISECPVVFGDLLITGEAKTRQKAGLPTIGDAHEVFGDSGWAIKGLSQKVVIINNNCALAWSGSYMAARVAISELREMSNSAPLTADGVRAFLSSHPDIIKHGASFIGYVFEQECRKIKQFRHDAEIYNSTTFGRMMIQGSGAGAIKELSDMFSSTRMRETGQVDAKKKALSACLAMAGMLLNAELRGGASANNLHSMFGGGYEVAVFSDGAFRKVGDLTFLIWTARSTSSGTELTMPHMIVKQAYAGDNLLIRSVRVDNNSGQAVILDEQCHIIKPMYESDEYVDENIFSEISYNSPLLCHCVLVEDENSKFHTIYTRVQLSTSNSPIQFNEEDERLVISFEQNFLQNIARSLQEALSPS
ncbi:hypothetical protein SAMN05216593_109197 [Pseudomonas asturiensis]|uniref:Uncharacterized protein n=1 Tax=Pseudomonas asturiensis TaxID=1190415 RepID=A0A1M7PC90_9PSED|nr:hypothetical protein [Pseudomonas asturiensis]SHN14460.1 hypothetical protein SAMN05216593_109197 [Pseudomonas asturiensis]